MFLKLLDFLFPPRCPGCNQPSPGFCRACLGEIEPARAPALAGLAEIRVAGLYSGPLKHAILNLKFRGKVSQARALAELLDPPPGLLVPVPSPFLRHHLRGFNLAELLARALGRPWQNALRCSGRRHQQKSLNRAARLRNDGFLARSQVQGPVVLVDDVLVTGTTLISCARALRVAGASEVRAVVVAYQGRPDVHIGATTSRGRPGNL